MRIILIISSYIIMIIMIVDIITIIIRAGTAWHGSATPRHVPSTVYRACRSR